DPVLSTRARPVAQSLNTALFIAVVPLVRRRPAQPRQPRCFLMLHPLEHVRNHQNPLADTPALASCQAPQLGRPRFAAEEVCWHRPSPKHGTLAYQLYHIWGSLEAGINRRDLPLVSGMSLPRAARGRPILLLDWGWRPVRRACRSASGRDQD